MLYYLLREAYNLDPWPIQDVQPKDLGNGPESTQGRPIGWMLKRVIDGVFSP